MSHKKCPFALDSVWTELTSLYLYSLDLTMQLSLRQIFESSDYKVSSQRKAFLTAAPAPHASRGVDLYSPLLVLVLASELVPTQLVLLWGVWGVCSAKQGGEYYLRLTVISVGGSRRPRFLYTGYMKQYSHHSCNITSVNQCESCASTEIAKAFL